MEYAGLEFHLWRCWKGKAIFIFQRTLFHCQLETFKGHKDHDQGQWRHGHLYGLHVIPGLEYKILINATIIYLEAINTSEWVSLWSSLLYVLMYFVQVSLCLSFSLLFDLLLHSYLIWVTFNFLNIYSNSEFLVTKLFLSPYLIVWVFPATILWGFLPTSKTETSFLVFSLLGSE